MKTMTRVPTGYTIEKVDMATAEQPIVDGLVELWHALDAEAVPEDPPLPREMIEARFRTTSKMFVRQSWLAFKDGRVVGRGQNFENKSGSNEDKRDIDLAVHPAHRGKGIGRALFAAAVLPIPDATTKLVQSWTHSRVPSGKAFAEKTGAKAGLNMRSSQLDLQKVDMKLIDEWAKIDPPDYTVVFLDGDVPDHLMKATTEAFNAINKMPREDLDMDDWVFSEATIRDWERMRKARGQTQWLYLVTDPSGTGVAFTDIVFDKRYEHVIHQGGTAVDPAHQGHGLGKLVKALMVKKLKSEMPRARFIRTENAGSNAPMLSINTRMGFALAWENAIWQLPLADAKKYAERAS
ncbi:MAG: GNAT family N-acetyltransferase [Chloroflexi bacterium]|nr:GNAT family N-acetyltransferase [Chloroflexota bacterium]